jgi:hypothetical protein
VRHFSILGSIPLLEAINLSHNKIRNLDACSFCGCNISQVFLAHNFLGVDKEAIHPEAFADTKMTELDLSFNYLDQFDASMLGKKNNKYAKKYGKFIFSARTTISQSPPLVRKFVWWLPPSPNL